MKKHSFVLTVGITCTLLAFAACGGREKNLENASRQSVDAEENSSSENMEDGRNKLLEIETDDDQFGTIGNSTRYSLNAQKVKTISRYQTSFRKTVGEDMDVIYLGMPRKLNVSGVDGSEWMTSDEHVATVQDGIVTGWSEGRVTITQKKENQILQEWQFAVTTFNDGRQAEVSFELGREEIRRLLTDECGIHEPAFWQSHINTLQDVITYAQERGFALDYDLPLLCTVDSEWLWSVPGDMVLIENRGSASDLSNVACYLLQNDFEDQGYILVFGNDSKVLSWFYEDGNYYLFYFRQLLRDIRDGKTEESYEPFKTDSFDEFKNEILSQVNLEETLTILMTSNQGHDFQPPVYMSYLHDSSEIYYKHVVIGLEDVILSGTKILYSSTDFDYEIKSVPTDEIPKGIPRYGENSGNLYEYE